ncbi:L-histidine N(alpha)-methyltransferase [Aridibaculum aurantiacum]|uniref:L-histidine N(alpha)-methyltransferase n=1 Tax=Aridibaculum aurantiacum TaxID=2810307 RepID=UPI001A9568E1|nr:L-histidine N(alpha)-methyltransferase [Aridibaculum aurantiacum]
MDQFLQEVIKGLSSSPKQLDSKYFYDATGDQIFQQIMHSEEYYLTRCEMEIFQEQSIKIASALTAISPTFDIVELGAGDATKSVHLLKQLSNMGISYSYMPIDISNNVIQQLEKQLPLQVPGINIQGLNGEYFSMLEKVKTLSNNIKVILFLGSNIGNIPIEESQHFLTELRSHLNPRDLVFIGFDLQKDPQVILDAYNDKAGLTRDFNFNLLRRINSELSGNFQLQHFKHFPTYDPGTGACKSYLVSMQDQQVEIADHTFHFKQYEAVFMEVSQKYLPQQVDDLASQSGFKSLQKFYDNKHWFVDVLWQVSNQ